MTGIGWQPIAVLAIGISFCVDEDPNFTTIINKINKPKKGVVLSQFETEK